MEEAADALYRFLYHEHNQADDWLVGVVPEGTVLVIVVTDVPGPVPERHELPTYWRGYVVQDELRYTSHGWLSHVAN